VSKKETEFERYERMQKLQKEAELTKRKVRGSELASMKKKTKVSGSSKNRNWTRDYELGILEEDEYIL